MASTTDRSEAPLVRLVRGLHRRAPARQDSEEAAKDARSTSKVRSPQVRGRWPDIVPGAAFPDYELADHHGKHRTLSELQGGIRWCWCSPAEVSVQRKGGNTKDFCNSIARCRWATAVS